MRPLKLPLACLACVLVAIMTGCCGGRLMSLQLYETSAGASLGPECIGGGRHPGGWLGPLRLHAPPLADPYASQSFRGPAFAAPLPRFHPVPTRPVFEPAGGSGPLQLLEPAGAAANASQANSSFASDQVSVLR